MHLFILRHGKAKSGSPDALRELEKQGIKELHSVINRRQDALKNVSLIQSSTLVRAEQTAAIAANLIGFEADIEENMQLAPWSRPTDFVNNIDESLGDLLIVSHQPFIGELVALLMGEDLWMPTSSLVCLSAEIMAPSMANLLWQESPKS